MSKIAPTIWQFKARLGTQPQAQDALSDRSDLIPSRDTSPEPTQPACLLYQELEDASIDEFNPIVEDLRILLIEYSVLRQHLIDDLNDLINSSEKPNQKPIDPTLIRKLIIARDAALTLSYVSEKLMHTKQDVKRLIDEQLRYEDWLAHLEYHYHRDHDTKRVSPPQNPSFTQEIRSHIRDLNPLRLLLVRIRRLIITIITLMILLGWLNPSVLAFDLLLAPFFAYLAWIFFVPRLLIGSYLLIQHVFFPIGREENLAFDSRARSQLSRRWADLANDFGWFLSGFVTCFLLYGSWQPFAIFVAVGMQCYDLSLIIFRTYLELSSLQKRIDQRNLLDENRDLIATDVAHLQKRLELERSILIVALINFSTLFIAVLLTLPIMATISSLFPILGAGISVAITIITYVTSSDYNEYRLNQYDRKQIPDVKDRLRRSYSEERPITPHSIALPELGIDTDECPTPIPS